MVERTHEERVAELMAMTPALDAEGASSG